MGNGAAVSGWGAALAHGTTCLCDLMQISFFFFFQKDFFFFFIFFPGDLEEGNEGGTDPTEAPSRGSADMSMHEHTHSPTWSRT